MFKGIYVALITPFNDDLSVDYITLEKLINFHIENKTDGIVALGTTGEAATLTKEEYIKVISFIVEKTKNKDIKIIAGVGTNSFDKTLENIQIVENIGVDGLLVVTPYYNKPSQRGLYKYFSDIASNTKLPIILYDIPGRTGTKIDNNIIYELSKIENIVSLKDATGDILSMYEVYRKVSNDFTILSGEDNLYYAQLSYGCVGTISVLANIYPKEMKEMTRLYNKGDNIKAFEIFEKLYNISSNLFIEGNPVTPKAYMYLKGMIPNMKVRSPLIEVSKETLNKLNKIME